MGTDILALQKLLNKYEGCNLVEDGVYGERTSEAVDEYLNQHNNMEVIEASIGEPKTEHFCLKEYYSGEFVNREKRTKIIKPPVEVYDSIQKNMEHLELLRSELGGMPIVITSGYKN